MPRIISSIPSEYGYWPQTFRFVLCEGTYITQGIQRRSKFHSLGAKKVVMFIKTRTCFLLMVKRSETESPESLMLIRQVVVNGSQHVTVCSHLTSKFNIMRMVQLCR